MHKLLKYTYFILCFMGLFTLRVNAYIDPSVMTYAIQAIAGVAIALGTLFSLYWRKILKFIRKLFGVRASKHLNNETDEIVYNDPISKDELTYKSISKDKINESINRELIVGKVEKKEVKEEVVEVRPKSLNEYINYIKNNIVSGLLLSLSIAFMIGYYAPNEIYMNNMDEFWFNYKVLNNECIGLSLEIFLCILLIYLIVLLINKKLYKILLVIGFSALIILYFEGNFLASNLPPIDGTTIDWSLYSSDINNSIILTILSFVVVIYLSKILTNDKFNQVVSFISIALILVLGVSIISIARKTNGTDPKDGKYYVTTVNENSYSSNDNYIIMVVDSVSSDIFHNLLNNNSEYKEAFKDFTYYPNTTGAYPYTDQALPFIMTGQWYENQKIKYDFKKEAITNSRLFKLMEDNGYRLDVYEEEVLDDNNMSRYSNVVEENFEINDDGLFKSLTLNLALYKYSPYYIKQFIKTDISSFQLTRKSKYDNEAFSSLDKYFFEELENGEYYTSEDKVFKFIHLEGAHVPFDYDEYGNQIEEDTGTYTQKIQANIVMLNMYLNKLKELGIYDEAKIVILADHGFADGLGNDTDDWNIVNIRSNPILLIKGSNEDHELIVSDEPVSYDNLQDMYQNLFNGVSGDKVFDGLLENNDRRRFLTYQVNKSNIMYEFYQTGYATDVSTMIKTGNVYTADYN